MSTEPIRKLLNKWKVEKLTVEMAIGHLLQHADIKHESDEQAKQERRKIMRTLDEIQVTLKSLRHDVDSLIAHTSMPPTPPKRKRGRPRKNDGE